MKNEDSYTSALGKVAGRFSATVATALLFVLGVGLVAVTVKWVASWF